VIDLHAHILPGIDDGPPTTEAALEMARTAVAAGTRAMATTSHIAHVFSLDPEQIVHGRETLAARLAYEGINLELLAGGEIAHDRLPELDDEMLRTLTLGGGPYVLLECPFTPIGDGLEPLVDDLHERGFEVLLAHPERSVSFQRDPALLATLVDQGALAQVTVGSLTGHFGRIPQRTAEMMVREELVHVLATDAHDVAGRAPVLHVNGSLTAAQYEQMTTVVPGAIVAGQPVRSS
jgi:protein-tyrosine phosphatase